VQRDAIRQKYHLADEQIARLVHNLTVATERVIPHEPPPVSSRDPKPGLFMRLFVPNMRYLFRPLSHYMLRSGAVRE
jgi:hypothetical protein